MEKSFSLIITPTQEISDEIKNKTCRVFRNQKIDPHISLCTSILSKRADFVDKIGYWLEGQDPFIFTLDRIDSFSKTRATYLTSSDREEIERFNQLCFGVRSFLSRGIKIRGRKEVFPHLYLGSFDSSKNLQKAKAKYRSCFSEPIPMFISEVRVTERIGKFRWKTIEHLSIGEPNKDFSESFYVWNKERASVE